MIGIHDPIESNLHIFFVLINNNDLLEMLKENPNLRRCKRNISDRGILSLCVQKCNKIQYFL